MVQLRAGDGAPVAPARVHDDGAEAARAEVGERGAHVGLVRAAREAVRDEHYRLRARGIGSLTIKKRGVDVVPDQLRKRLDLSGDAEATIVLTRAAGSGIALLVAPF